MVILTTFHSSYPRTADIFSFSSVLVNLFYQNAIVFLIEVFSSLVRCIPRDLFFFLFEGADNGIVFLIYFLVGLLLVLRNTIDFCELIMYPATLSNLFISFRCLLVAFFGGSLM